MHRGFLFLRWKVGAGAFVAPTHGCSSVAPFLLQDSRWACSYSRLPRSPFNSFYCWVSSVLLPWWSHRLLWWDSHFIKVGSIKVGPVPSPSSWVPRCTSGIKFSFDFPNTPSSWIFPFTVSTQWTSRSSMEVKTIALHRQFNQFYSCASLNPCNRS